MSSGKKEDQTKKVTSGALGSKQPKAEGGQVAWRCRHESRERAAPRLAECNLAATHGDQPREFPSFVRCIRHVEAACSQSVGAGMPHAQIW